MYIHGLYYVQTHMHSFAAYPVQVGRLPDGGRRARAAQVAAAAAEVVQEEPAAPPQASTDAEDDTGDNLGPGSNCARATGRLRQVTPPS